MTLGNWVISVNLSMLRFKVKHTEKKHSLCMVTFFLRVSAKIFALSLKNEICRYITMNIELSSYQQYKSNPNVWNLIEM